MTDWGTTATRGSRADDRGRLLAEAAGLRDDLTARVGALEAEVAALRRAVEASRTVPAVLAPEPLLDLDVAFAPLLAPAPTALRPAPTGKAPPVDQAPAERAPARRRGRPTLPVALFTVGALTVADAAVTVVWQEPVSAIYATWQQDRLDGQLAELDRSLAGGDVGLSPAEETRLRRASARERAQRRMTALARRYERRLRTGRPLGRLEIDRLDERQVIVEGVGGGQLRGGPGRYPTGSLPGLGGTFGIAGHRTSWAAPFRKIDKLRRGDKIVVTMPYGRFTYAVTSTRIVKPSDVWVLQGRRRSRLVLTACHPLFSARQRIVVTAELRRATPRGAALRSS